MKSGRSTVQYTLRQVPENVNAALRKKSRETGQSMNQLAIEALTKGLGLADAKVRYHDLDGVAGSWVEDPAFDAAIQAQDRIDPDLWKE